MDNKELLPEKQNINVILKATNQAGNEIYDVTFNVMSDSLNIVSEHILLDGVNRIAVKASGILNFVEIVSPRKTP